MPTLTNNLAEQVHATSVRFVDRMLYVSLSDGRDIGLPLLKYFWDRGCEFIREGGLHSWWWNPNQ